jgi:hypothetical protein
MARADAFDPRWCCGARTVMHQQLSIHESTFAAAFDARGYVSCTLANRGPTWPSHAVRYEHLCKIFPRSDQCPVMHATDASRATAVPHCMPPILVPHRMPTKPHSVGTGSITAGGQFEGAPCNGSIRRAREDCTTVDWRVRCECT